MKSCNFAKIFNAYDKVDYISNQSPEDTFVTSGNFLYYFVVSLSFIHEIITRILVHNKRLLFKAAFYYLFYLLSILFYRFDASFDGFKVIIHLKASVNGAESIQASVEILAVSILSI